MSQVGSSYTLSTRTELAFSDAVARVRDELTHETVNQTTAFRLEALHRPLPLARPAFARQDASA